MVIYWLHNMDWMLIINYIICRLYTTLSSKLYKNIVDYVCAMSVFRWGEI